MLPKPRPKLLDKRQAAATKDTNWRNVAAAVKLRDKGMCRLCGRKGVDPHHIVMRSLGGRDEVSNALLTCRRCHDDIHGHVIKLDGTASSLIIGRYSDELDQWVWGRK